MIQVIVTNLDDTLLKYDKNKAMNFQMLCFLLLQ